MSSADRSPRRRSATSSAKFRRARRNATASTIEGSTDDREVGMATVETATEIRAFQIDIPEEALKDLRSRIEVTRLPSKELVDDRSQGVQLATVQALARYWATDYDFGRVAARLNALPQFKTEIDGVDIHFIHVRSQHENALPLIMTHGWPGSVIELLDTVGPLTDPSAHGGRPEDAFDLVLPSVPGYGFSGEPVEIGWELGGPHAPGPSLWTDSATPATLPRAATWGRASPTRWAAKHPKA
jgi:hypothetical protein